MDIRVVITRTAIFATVYALVLGLPFMLIKFGRDWLINLLGTGWWIGPLALMASLATAGPFAYIYLLRSAEAILLKEQLNYRDTLKQAAAGIVRIRKSKELLDYIAHTVTETLAISHAAIYLLDTGIKQFILKAGHNLKKHQSVSIDKDDAVIVWLESHKEPLVYEEIKRKSEDEPDPAFKKLEEQMRNLNATVILASLLDDRLFTILLLGSKLSGRAYTSEDLTNFSVFVSEATLAIENALRYENIEEQVKQRTAQLVDVQKQLIQAEKLATIGTLAGGVAHEINNPLAVILTNVQMLLAENSADAALDKESLEMIEEATKRCRTIVQKLMVFAKKPMETTSVAEVDLFIVVKNIVEFLRYQLEQENITISVHAPQEQYVVIGNQNELEQVIGNIIINARDAIKQIKKNGGIDVTLAKDDGRIKVAVKDEGAGIPKEILPRIFDPFFTTKDVGKGLGLGLSICQAIIEKYRGTIVVQSEPGKGSIFTIQFPRAKAQAKI
jgi:C4-dicarboxylate-specific signal transduction histidine kinase